MKPSFLLTVLPLFWWIHAEAETVASAHLTMDGAVPEIYKTASGYDLFLYRFDPEGHDPNTDRRPAVVFFFGGGWNGGSPTQFERHSRYLASRGMVAFVADYRVRSRQEATPNLCVEDGKSSVRWIRQHAERLGIDPTNVIAGGGSAGGHVAAAAGMCDGFEAEGEDLSISSKPVALLLFNPVYDNGPEGYGHARVEEWFPAISPAHNITKDDPPAIVFLGSQDKLIPVATGETFRDDMEALGLLSELHVYEGAAHGFFNGRKDEEKLYFEDTLLKMDQFLTKLRYLNGKPDTDLMAALAAETWKK
ncbi:MAG: alpha/beta hydrolase fold domain-containing protein [Verrucomicrobiota bacterium]